MSAQARSSGTRGPEIRERCELAILGGGCAGLSLATRLAASPYAPHTQVLEARDRYVDDRTWCYWGPAEHPFDRLEAHRWTRWGVRGTDGTSTLREAGATPYVMLRAGDVYREAREVIADSERVALRTGVRVESVRETPGGVRIDSDGGVLLADRVIDTRVDTDLIGGARLLQHFMGREVALDRDAFDPETALLMDFDVRQDRGLHFVYCLPTSRRRALIETTYFSETTLDAADYAADVDAYLERVAPGASVAILREERGVLPMDADLPLPRDTARVTHAGIAGGAVRASTGYAFLEIQRWAERQAGRLLGSRAPAPSARSGLLRPMDRVFLDFLRRQPELAPAAFVAMFESVGTGSLARFLTDRPGPMDLLSIVRSLPVGPLSRAALRTAGGRA